MHLRQVAIYISFALFNPRIVASKACRTPAPPWVLGRSVRMSSLSQETELGACAGACASIICYHGAQFGAVGLRVRLSSFLLPVHTNSALGSYKHPSSSRTAQARSEATWCDVPPHLILPENGMDGDACAGPAAGTPLLCCRSCCWGWRSGSCWWLLLPKLSLAASAPALSSRLKFRCPRTASAHTPSGSRRRASSAAATRCALGGAAAAPAAALPVASCMRDAAAAAAKGSGLVKHTLGGSCLRAWGVGACTLACA